MKTDEREVKGCNEYLPSHQLFQHTACCPLRSSHGSLKLGETHLKIMAEGFIYIFLKKLKSFLNSNFKITNF